MRSEEISSIVRKQKEFFALGKTHKTQYRIDALKRLRASILRHEQEVYDALKKDLGKSKSESYMCEVGLVLSEIGYMLKNIKKFSADRKQLADIAQFPATYVIKPSPYGTVLIMSPWNYPFLLSIEPFVDALAAGNTAVIKPSAYSPNVSAVIKSIIDDSFAPEYASVVLGGREESKSLLDEKFDYMFFTGSQAVGKEVLRHAAENIIPVSLELGGKSPCIVDDTAKIELAAKRIVFGKFINCGQTCVAPDYILCDEKIADRLVDEIIRQIKAQYGDCPLDNPNYGKIVNNKHFERLLSLIDANKVVFGGNSQSDKLRIEPTVMKNVEWTDSIMQEEIFGPILPVLAYRDFKSAVEYLNRLPHPLALYIFSEDKNAIGHVTERCSFGGACTNDTIMHVGTSKMGFGGVGSSGMGTYHGKAGFETFSHKKSIVRKGTWLDVNIRYSPYSKKKDKLISMFLK